MRKLDLWYPKTWLESAFFCFLAVAGWEAGKYSAGAMFPVNNQHQPLVTYGRVALSEGGFFVQEVTYQHFDGSGELVKEEKKWEMVRRLTPKESFYLKGVDTNPDMVKDMSVPGAQLRKS